jgi:hypothetical protein
VTRHVLDAGVGDPAPRPGWSVIDIGDRLRGGRFDGDLVPEGFKFADEPAFAGAGVVDAAGEIVRAEVAVGGVLASTCQMITIKVWAVAVAAFWPPFLPKRQ